MPESAFTPRTRAEVAAQHPSLDAGPEPLFVLPSLNPDMIVNRDDGYGDGDPADLRRVPLS